MKEELLPNNLAAEQAVLGAILYEPTNMHLVADRLSPDDFYAHSYRHHTIYSAMLDLYHAGEDVSLTIVADRLAASGVTHIKDALAQHYLNELWQDAMWKGESIKKLADIVQNEALGRQLYTFLRDASQVLSAEHNRHVALNKISSLLQRLHGSVATSDLEPLSKIMMDFLNDLDPTEREAGKVVGLPTGFSDLDFLLGGLQPQDLYILGGRPSEGKTSVLLNIIYYLLMRYHLNIAFFSLEMSKRKVARRLASMDAMIDSQRIRARTLEDEEWDALVKSTTETLADEHVFVDETGDLSIEAIRTKSMRHKMQHGLDLICIDFLQMMSVDEDERRRIDRRQEIDKISRGLKQLAKELNVPVLAMASLSRAVESRAGQPGGYKRPQLSDLRESGSIESDADVVMFISRSREKAGYSIINIEKHRDGPIGDVWLRFDSSLTRFHDVKPGEVPL